MRIVFSAGQIQKKYKHAPDFGVTGHWNKQNGEAFKQAILNHINKPGVLKISAPYKGKPVTHYYDPATDLKGYVEFAQSIGASTKSSNCPS